MYLVNTQIILWTTARIFTAIECIPRISYAQISVQIANWKKGLSFWEVKTSSSFAGTLDVSETLYDRTISFRYFNSEKYNWLPQIWDTIPTSIIDHRLLITRTLELISQPTFLQNNYNISSYFILWNFVLTFFWKELIFPVVFAHVPVLYPNFLIINFMFTDVSSSYVATVAEINSVVEDEWFA